MSATGIVIVTWNSGEEIGACLDAARRTGAEIVVVDNASEDHTLREVQQRGVRIIANNRNLGFAAAVNQGVRALDAPLILLLNPDAVIEGGIEALRRHCVSPGTAGAGGMLLDDQGRPQSGFMVRRFPTAATLGFEALGLNRLWPNNPVNWHYRCKDLSEAATAEVEQPAGAFFMIRRQVWEELGGFDEGFFPLWFEDVDFCKRAQDAGYRIYFVPEAVAKHRGAHSIRKMTLEFRQFYWYRSLLRYSAKHFRPVQLKVICLAVVVGSVLRTALEVFRERSLKPIAVYGRVVRLAGRYLISGRQDGVAALSFP
jgi:N-acetylglucosaminyl-diphospho-decaprenol L-rhamnosyltransferase